MANIGTLTSSMPGLWREEAFWGFFSPDTNVSSKRKELMQQMEREGRIRVSIESHRFLKNIQKYISEEKLRKIYKTNFLDGSQQYPPIECILALGEPDAVTTISRYTEDERLAHALAEIFPDREIKCSWFVDGMGDYGSYTILGHEVLNVTSGNLQEDLAAAEAVQEGPDTDIDDDSWAIADCAACDEAFKNDLERYPFCKKQVEGEKKT